MEINKDTENYLKKFYDDKFTTYDFLTLFCALNVIKQNYSFNRDNLLLFIINCKENHEFDILLHSIKLKNNGIYKYSLELEEGISQLKVRGILHTIFPENNSSIYINNNLSVESLIKPRIDYLDDMVDFITKYSKWEEKQARNRNNDIYNFELTQINSMMKKIKK